MSDQNQKEVVKKAKGTKVTEGIIGAASSKIVMATKNLQDAVQTALKLTETYDENALKIADQEEKLSGLGLEFNNKKTQNKIDLEFAFKADQRTFVDKYLADNKLIAVMKEEFVSLNTELEDLKKSFDSKVQAEIAKANGIANSKVETEKRLAEALYQAKEAQNLAKIENLTSQLAFANKQSDSWEKQLYSERQASIDRSKNSSATVNVAGSGK